MYLLAQLVDILPQWAWNVVGVVCTASPVVGYCIGRLVHGKKSEHRATVMQVYYALLVASYFAANHWMYTPGVGLAAMLILVAGIPVGMVLIAM